MRVTGQDDGRQTRSAAARLPAGPPAPPRLTARQARGYDQAAGAGARSRRQPAAGAQLPSLSSEAPASGPSSPSVEQPRTRVTNLPKKTSTCVLFLPYQIPASHSVGPTGGDTVNCYSFTFFSSPSLSVNISSHSYAPLYLELIFNYLLNQTGKPGRSTWPPWAWLGGRTPSAGRGG